MRLLIALLLGSALLLAACDRQSERAPQGDSAERGTLVPDLAFSDPDGTTMQLSDFRGTPMLINLWATWCTPCIHEMPTLDALAARESGIRVLTISQDSDGARHVRPYFEESGFTHLEPWLDDSNSMIAALALDKLPVTVLYGADGKELFRVYGSMDWSGERAATLISDALGE